MIKLGDSIFRDFYDNEFNNKSKLIYNRVRKLFKNRMEELSFLESKHIKTVNFGSLYSVGIHDRYVVYTDITRHNFEGKRIENYSTVVNIYSNFLLSEFLDESQGYMIKYLQVGRRRFRILYYNERYNNLLANGKMIDVQELEASYNDNIALPIYSIDFVSKGMEMIAVDFNEIENLSKIGADKFLSSEEVIEELYKAILRYSF